MFRGIDSYEFEIFEDENGGIVATCDIFPVLCGTGEDAEQAADDLAAEIADYLRNTVTH